MKGLKGILIFLVIVLVVILGVGGYMVGFNHTGHQTTATSQKGENTKANNSLSTNDMPNMNSDTQSASVEQGVYGNQNQQIPMGPVVVAEAQVPPEEYLKKMQEAMGMIKDATGLMANTPYVNENTDPGTNQQMNSPSTGVEMDKIHQGIYKMAQGTTLMDQAMTGMQEEVDKAQEKGMSLYQIPSWNQQYYSYNPSMNAPYLNGGYPVTPYINPYFSQLYPNANQQNQTSNQQNQNPNQQNQNPNQPNQNGTANNSHGQSDQASSDSQASGINQMNHGASGMGFNFNFQSVTYLIYGILVLSLFGIVVAIIGFITNLFKPAKAEEQRGESIVG